MKQAERKKALLAAVDAALCAGRRLRRSVLSAKTTREVSRHDVKLELDFECQALITRHLLRQFPDSYVLGEEELAGNPNSPFRWVVDPIDGTVNFFHGIPHAAVSIALELPGNACFPTTSRAERPQDTQGPEDNNGDDFASVVGVVYDPFLDELWTAAEGESARLNGKTVRVSQQRQLVRAMISVGFGKQPSLLNNALPVFGQLARKARKVRITGSAALALAYVATGRFDAHIGTGIRLWDVAAGGLLVRCAGGKVSVDSGTAQRAGGILASNGLLSRPLERLAARMLSR